MARSSSVDQVMKGVYVQEADRKLVIELHTTADDSRPVFLAGNFNSWKAGDKAFQMINLGDGKYSFTFFSFMLKDMSNIEYKFVKGGWECEELGDDGLPTDNRVLFTREGKVVETVSRWKKHESWYDQAFYPIIEIASKQFLLPQLSRKRRISVLLPYDYKTSPKKRYPVLYLQDGQNLFDNTAPYGTWGVDKHMARLAQEGKGEFIVVAIDHGGKQRISEYSPVTTAQVGEGLGKEYAKFLAETLKPFIDQKYRTKPDFEHTGIGGSSMGGLISLFAGLLYPQVFSKFMIFSPSLWLTPAMIQGFQTFPIPQKTKFFFFAGGKEPAHMLTNTALLHQAISQRQLPQVTSVIQINREATHSEYFWGKAFPEGASTLYAK